MYKTPFRGFSSSFFFYEKEKKKQKRKRYEKSKYDLFKSHIRFAPSKRERMLRTLFQ